MSEIASELLNFDRTVTPALDGMKGSASNLESIFDGLKNINLGTKTGVDSYYQSKDKDKVISSFDLLIDSCDSIRDCISNDLNKLLSECGTLSSRIKELTSLDKEIKELQQAINITTDIDKKKLQQKNLDNLCNRFNNLSDDAKGLLNKLKTYSNPLKVKQTRTLANTISESITGRTFKAENITVDGVDMRYYIYLPKYDSDVGPLPAMMYMYGLDLNNHDENLITYGGLGKLIHDGKSPTGAVIIPYVQNGQLYEVKGFRDRLAKLPFAIAAEYKKQNNGKDFIDVNRISLGGTSYGAVTAYRLVNEHPGQYSAIVAAYGAGDITSAFKGMKVFNYTGRGGYNHTNLNYIRAQTKKINEIGGEATLKEYDNTWNHTNVGTMAFSENVTDENGKPISVIEAAFREVRS